MLTTNEPMVTTRYAGLKWILEERRRLLRSGGQDKVRDVRDHGTVGGSLREVLDGVEVSEADVQEEIELGVIQLKTEMLGKIDEALVRLRNGDLRRQDSRLARRGDGPGNDGARGR